MSNPDTRSQHSCAARGGERTFRFRRSSWRKDLSFLLPKKSVCKAASVWKTRIVQKIIDLCSILFFWLIELLKSGFVFAGPLTTVSPFLFFGVGVFLCSHMYVT